MKNLVTEPLIAVRFFPELNSDNVIKIKHHFNTNDFLLAACATHLITINSKYVNTNKIDLFNKSKEVYKEIIFSNKTFFINYFKSKEIPETDFDIVQRITGVDKGTCKEFMYHVDYEHPLKAACYHKVVNENYNVDKFLEKKLTIKEKIQILFEELIDIFDELKEKIISTVLNVEDTKKDITKTIINLKKEKEENKSKVIQLKSKEVKPFKFGN